MPMLFQFKTEPLPHQLEEFNLARSLEDRAEWWDPGVGKTKPVIDTVASLADEGAIDALLVLAPRGVHINWTRTEIPKHMPDAVRERFRMMAWSSEKSGNKGFQEEARGLLAHKGPVVLSMNHDAVMTDDGSDLAKELLDSRRCLMCVDEGHRIKTPKAKRTIRILAMGRHAPYRRILTGSPVDNSPFDAYTQVRFLDPMAWAGLGVSNFAAFKSFFGEWTTGWNGQQGREFKHLNSYRNLPLLNEVLLRYGSRLRKDDVLKLPPKGRCRVYFEMTPGQRRVYDQLKDELMAVLEDGSTATAELRIVLQTRLGQVTSGYIPNDDERRLVPLATPNPRIRALLDVIEDHPGQALIWCRYDPEVDAVLEALRKAGETAVRYDGRDNDKARSESEAAFHSGASRFFVGKPGAGGIGLTLNEARTVIYYSNSFSLTDRRQSEDRAHRIGQEKVVTYVDLVAERSIDEYVLQKLADKRSVSAAVLGDPDLGLI